MATSVSPHRHMQRRRRPYGHTHSRPRPLSPPTCETKCSLPSIANLLGLADACSASQENASPWDRQSPQCDDVFQRARPEAHGWSYDRPPEPRLATALAPEYPRGIPPSPPMSTDASYDGYSPTAKTTNKLTTAVQTYQHERTPPPLDGLRQRDSHQPTSQPTQQAPPLVAFSQRFPPLAPCSRAPLGVLPSYATPSAPMPSHRRQQQLPAAGMYGQLADQSLSSVPLAPAGPSPWQHHHYLSPSYDGFPQSQDRYVCSTCNKAFSRPSSLRIHSHSHTGEKPFKCPHTGCGKAFSVRSNMKRHERGCHSFEVTTANGDFSACLGGRP